MPTRRKFDLELILQSSALECPDCHTVIDHAECKCVDGEWHAQCPLRVFDYFDESFFSQTDEQRGLTRFTSSKNNA
jgi:hypothetical protein